MLKRTGLLALGGVLLLFVLTVSGSSAASGVDLTFHHGFLQRATGASSPAARQGSRVSYDAHLRLHFEANQGQVDPIALFIANGPGYRLFLTQSDLVLASREVQPARQAEELEPSQRDVHTLRLAFPGANAAPLLVGDGQLQGRANYFIGSNPSAWHTDIPTFQGVRYQNLYPGIDLLVYGNQGQLEYDFEVAPGADVDGIRLRFDGIDDLAISAAGDLVLSTRGGSIVQKAPVIYQMIAGSRRTVAGHYRRFADGTVGFAIGAYDPAHPLIIDPILIYSTYLGGTDEEVGMAIAVDGMGQAYVTGVTDSIDFPMDDAFQPALSGNADVFVTKLDADGMLLYSTYIGGEQNDAGSDIAIGSDGSAYVVGYTASANFPTSNALDGTLTGQFDAFLTRLSPSGNFLLFSTYLGGEAVEFAHGVAVNNADDAYVVGHTSSADFPTVNPFQPGFGDGLADVFISRFRADGSALTYSTYLGGSGDDCFLGFGAGGNVPNINCGVAVDGEGAATIAGTTNSENFPTQNPLQANLAGSSDVFVARLEPDGDGLIYSTYLGGSTREGAQDVAVDSEGNAYVTGWTSSDDFPTTAGVVQGQLEGPIDAFVTKVAADDSALLYSTFLGGAAVEEGHGIAVDAENNASVTGWTNSMDFPVQDPVQQALSGISDGFVTTLNTDASALLFSTYLGGERSETARSIAVDAEGALYVTGNTGSEDFPTLDPAQPTLAGGPQDAFVTKLGEAPWAYAFEYVAKVVCGLQRDAEEMRLVQGFYATTVNIHNPNEDDVLFFKKLALTFPPPEQRAGEIFPIAEDVLQYDEALAVDCMTIRDEVFGGELPTPYIEGFVVIQSPLSLDVVAVYTTGTLNERGEVAGHSSIDVERVPERALQDPPATERPDLVPDVPLPTDYDEVYPDHPFGELPSGFEEGLPGFYFCVHPGGGAAQEVRVLVRNEGAVAAGPSTTTVDFGAAGSASAATPALEPDEEVSLDFSIPDGCYMGGFSGICQFTFTVDAMDQIDEEDETNNSVESFCQQPAG